MATKRAVYEIADYKAAEDRPGEFTALVSVFGNVDLQGDRVMPGAFQKSLARWKAGGNELPVIWSHAWDDPFAHIGYVTKATEVSGGLQIVGKNDIDKPFAAQVHDLMTQRRVTGMSFAYDVINERRAKDGANELTELELIEVGPTLRGANPDAQLVQAKALLDHAADEARAQEGTTKNVAALEGEGVVAAVVAVRTALQEADNEKAGRRLSQATQTEMQAIRDDATALVTRIDTLLGTAEDEPKNATAGASDGDAEHPEAKDDHDDDREPPAKSPDEGVQSFKTRIETMRATTRTPT